VDEEGFVHNFVCFLFCVCVWVFSSAVMSSSQSPTTTLKCFSGGAEDFLQKPIFPTILLRRVEMCLVDRIRRKREEDLRCVLQKEKEKLKEKEEEIESLLSKVSEAVETPMQAVVKTIWQLLSTECSPDYYRQALVGVLKSLNQSDLYRPAFSQFLQNLQRSGSAPTDDVQKWLLDQYTKEGAVSEEPIRLAPSKGFGKPLASALTPERAVEVNTALTHDLSKEGLSKKPGDDPLSIEELRSFEYDVTLRTPNGMIADVIRMFDDLGIFEEFKIEKTVLISFIRVLQGQYNPNPYHNFMHCIDVCQFIYAIMKNGMIDAGKEMLTKMDRLVLVMAALIHDVDHPGLGNNFEVKVSSEFAILYNGMDSLFVCVCLWCACASIMKERHHSSFLSLCFCCYYCC
jgi:hypothetical protein